MNINKLIEIKENKHLIIKYINLDIVLIEYNDNNNDLITKDNKIAIKINKNGIYNFIIGYSMNLKFINIEHQNQIYNINRITEIKIDSKKDEFMYIHVEKQVLFFEIYIKINNYENMIKEINPIPKIKILLTKFIFSIGEYFKIIFNRRGLECEIITSLSIEECLSSIQTNTTYIILYNSEKHNLLPTNFIFYQIEQTESVFFNKEQYFKKMILMGKKSAKFWEYSKVATEFYIKYLKNKIQWVPMPFVSIKMDTKWYKEFDHCEYDIFFYGNKNYRRESILNELIKYFRLKIGWGYYEDKKLEFIGTSKIIINLHYYPNAGLETCRINEILNFDKIIISETSEMDKENIELYKDIIILVENIKDDLSNIKKLIKKIKYYLNKENYLEKINQNKKKINELEKKIDKLIKI